MFAEARLIPFSNSVIQVNYGICYQIVDVSWCYVSYTFGVHLFLHSQFSLLYSFYFRYKVLCDWEANTRNVVLSLLIIYIPSLVQFFLLANGEDSDQLVLWEVITKWFPEVKMEQVTGHLDVRTGPIAYGTMIFMISPLFIYPTILYLRSKIIKILDENLEHLRKETRILHQRLLKILTFQACLPIIFISGIILFTLEKLGIMFSPISECASTLSLEIIPALSPLIYFYYMTPYRHAILGFIGVRKNSRTIFQQTPSC
ncbi:unnamed protein product [Caenorhabditis angaria]|uniref:Uncharacterized protein n=1 Tax=Caenorhabditis angaria TaxID=860376 RepID=A0A9P1N7U2_9PELO|nr:unnamed protein product [Caenorhabditis angaria]